MSRWMPAIPIVLTIAGSDSGGGAGIQADLRTFAFHCVHGTSALTCVTAQNTIGVNRVDALPAAAVAAQIEAVSQDMVIGAVKTGMLLNADIISTVARQLARLSLNQQLVVDPVMISRAGVPLIDAAAVQALRQELLPLAQVLTPNRYEAQILANQAIHTLADMEQAAQRIHQLGPQYVLVKGGGMTGDWRAIDVWYDGNHLRTLATEVVDTPHTHGTGCTLSAAIAANLALGYEPLTATQRAKQYVTEALKYALAIGQGQGPVGHFFPLLSGDRAIPRECSMPGDG
ncbi:bifunctional hydroxymethylpyrimidine kinase/phosphomethylpyrimidine kinase [Trichothermofontia sichuanensis B231]|uniref:bifunctional hydroxymethylpyrimidine kinase/phosphomethylpyrimidine kinase n=1 Tax=Trichothermofontia sichuanensis TaxID=3045816 RepID=UPI002247E0D1|nr:bifunctional hydroxymethylpyrimidine kinase/phosphomethylpyrimidine kinase [Trichothermofontia sichuanensis]UZQ55741.1 bifunctional hydroxymethylpyrimidine kinase/phosphomethylpyrimidine kinase [Trichothermofontia sichuanensis B231]